MFRLPWIAKLATAAGTTAIAQTSVNFAWPRQLESRRMRRDRKAYATTWLAIMTKKEMLWVQPCQV